MMSTIDTIFWFLDSILIIAIAGFMCLAAIPLLGGLIFLYLKIKFWIQRRKDLNTFNVGFFHPYCNAGGGGERVLWTAVKALQSQYNDIQIYVYTGDLNADRETIIKNVKKVLI